MLAAFDDKIERNRRTSQTLESIAQTIFKSWFVDFDPVRAKRNGESRASICRRLAMPAEALNLFPSRLVGSPSGEVPEGWRFRPLAELTRYLSRGISPKYIEQGGIRVLNQKCVRDRQVSAREARRHDPEVRSVVGRGLEIGDILVNSTGVGTLGRVAQVLELDEPTIVDSHVAIVRADANETTRNYLGMALMHRQPEIEALGEGSTGQTELSRARLGALQILSPPPQLLAHFDAQTQGLRLHIAQLTKQSHMLAETRDALLPRLLSGELNVEVEVAEP